RPAADSGRRTRCVVRAQCYVLLLHPPVYAIPARRRRNYRRGRISVAAPAAGSALPIIHHAAWPVHATLDAIRKRGRMRAEITAAATAAPDWPDEALFDSEEQDEPLAGQDHSDAIDSLSYPLRGRLASPSCYVAAELR